MEENYYSQDMKCNIVFAELKRLRMDDLLLLNRK